MTLITFLFLILAADPQFSEAQPHPEGWLTHQVTSEYQPGTTLIHVLVPDSKSETSPLPLIYVLPVESMSDSRYGDPLQEIKKNNLHNRHQAIFAVPTFAQLPWYADHPEDPLIRQESYLLKVVLPFVEKQYAPLLTRENRLLLGFSKSGWGAWSLLLRHPDLFASAAAWDAPLMMDQPGKFGSGPIFGSIDNFQNYHLEKLIHQQQAQLQSSTRLVLSGYFGFRSDLQKTHSLLNELNIPHSYRDGPEREHNWHSGWVPESVEILLQTTKKSP